MSGLSVQIEGMPNLKRKFSGLSQVAQKKVLRKAMRGAAKPVVKAAKAKAPVRTGKLKKSIRTTVSMRRGKAEAKVGFGGKQYYGIFSELGTVKMPARPFLRPALDSQKDASVRAFVEVIQAEIAKVAR